MDNSTHIRLSDMDLTADNLEGAKIYDGEDGTVGTVSHVHGTGPTMRVIVDAGGFLGIGAKPVALEASKLEFLRDDDGAVYAKTPLTKDYVKDLPEHKD